jgi:hypothetical protein
MREWIALDAGTMSGAPVVGLDYVDQLQVGHSCGVAIRVGASFWRDIERASYAPRGGPSPSVGHGLWISQLTAGLAVTMRL